MIRATTPADSAELIAITQATGMFRPLEVEALEEVLADFFAMNIHDGHQSFTYEAGGKILGFAYIAPAPMTDRSWHLWWIVVRKDCQAQGVGSKLLAHAEAVIRGMMGRVLFIETGSLPHYEPTRRFYLKHGYDEHARLEEFYAPGDSMIVFRKALA